MANSDKRFIYANDNGGISIVCRQGGRVDRSDWQDVEPMCHFNIQEFKPIVDWRNNDKQVGKEQS